MHMRRIIAFAIVSLSVAAVIAGCAARRAPSPSPSPSPYGQTVVVPAPVYRADPDPDGAKTVLFITVPPQYYIDSVAYFARNGVDGIMVANLIGNWTQDIWAQPHMYTPDAPAGRPIGARNPLLALCRRMNERCAAAGIRHNSVKVSVPGSVPDWFDDVAWARIVGNLRQCAVFAREGGFAGVALDVEYASNQYVLDYPAYQAPEYPKHRLRDQARTRGREIAAAMLDGFPGMVFWHLPEWTLTNSPLGADLFAGMVEEFAARDAPGGFHISTEMTYLNIRPRGLLTLAQGDERTAVQTLGERGSRRALAWWKRRGAIAIGVWPLGYAREVKDSTGEVIGYTGKDETFHGALVGSYADKSENYPVADFRRQLAAARMISDGYVWIYCQGQVFWQMTPEQMARYRATPNDTLPTVRILGDYLSAMRERPVLDDSLLAEAAAAVRTHRPEPRYGGFPPRWWLVGPFPGRIGDFDRVLPPERTIDLAAAYPVGEPVADTLRWRATGADSVVNLSALLGKTGTPVAYGATWIELPASRRVWIGFGSNDYGAVFVNGRRAYASYEQRPVAVDDDRFPIDLPAGRSTIVVKCGDAGGSQWGFTLRVTDERGDPVPGLRWVEPADVAR